MDRIVEAPAQSLYNIGLEDIGKPVLVNGKEGYTLLSVKYTSGGLDALCMMPEGGNGWFDISTVASAQESMTI
jgi:hypothetical protein